MDTSCIFCGIVAGDAEASLLATSERTVTFLDVRPVGEVAGQEVFHAHLHVVARRHDDGMHIAVDFPPLPSREQLDTTAAAICEVL